jgi:adenosylcobinamide-GDP ribazoletransferase
MKPLLSALGFLTVLPMPAQQIERGDLGRAAPWFPFTGIMIGLVVCGVNIACRLVFPPLVCAAITAAGWAWITGGLHLDGVADCGDGFFAAASRERRLEIMRDPRMGAFGGIALLLFLLLKVAALSEVRGEFRGGAAFGPVFALMFAPIVARYMLLFVARLPAARPGGLGEEFSKTLKVSAFIVGAVVIAGVGALDPYPLRAAVAVGAAVLATACVIVAARSKLGGMTGDVLGLAVELSEVAVLLVYTTRLGL